VGPGAAGEQLIYDIDRLMFSVVAFAAALIIAILIKEYLS
jgi:hypothetical protein